MKKRTWIIGFVWGVIFIGWWIRGVIYRNWEFNIFSPKSWRYIRREFAEGWIIQTPSDWVFIISLILTIPLFFLGWWLCHKIYWLKLSSKASKKIIYATRKKTAILVPQKNTAPKPGFKLMRPKHMAGGGGPFHSSNTSAGNTAPPVMPSSSLLQETTKPTMPPPDALERKKPAFLEDDDELKAPPLIMTEPEMFADEPEEENAEVLADIIKTTPYHVWTDVMLQNVKLNFICADSKKLFIVFEDPEEGDWLADEEQFSDDPPLWFSESAHRISPIFSLNKIRKLIEEQIARKALDYSVQICYCLGKVNVVNWEEMKTVWKKLNIFVTQNHIKEDIQIPSFSETLPQAVGEANERAIGIFNDIF